MFDEFEQFQRFQATWNAVRIERAVEVGLFTFGDSDLPYYLVTSSSGRDAAGKAAMVKVRRGNVTVSRARIITPDTMHPELRNFFEEHEEILRECHFTTTNTMSIGYLASNHMIWH